VNEPEPGRLIRIVLNGMQGPMTVSGKQYNNSMIAWGGPPPPNGSGLTDEEIAAVLTYVRQEWGNKAPAVTAERVKLVREKIKGHPGAFTEAELMQVSPAD
jgi:mono/diheme cytochrome c family protein